MEGMLSKFRRKGLLSLTNIREGEIYDTFFHNQMLMLNDCLHRSRFFVRWVVNFDLDEYFVTSPQNSIHGYVEKYTDSYALTFGFVYFNIEHCSIQTQKSECLWEIEKRPFRRQKPFCNVNAKNLRGTIDFCEHAHGRRKWAVNPEIAVVVRPHEVETRWFLKNGYEKEIINASESGLAHFRRLLSVDDRSNCRFFHREDKEELEKNGLMLGSEEWVLDASLRNYVSKLRKLFSSNPLFVEKTSLCSADSA